jgi:hypothetical protein
MKALRNIEERNIPKALSLMPKIRSLNMTEKLEHLIELIDDEEYQEALQYIRDENLQKADIDDQFFYDDEPTILAKALYNDQYELAKELIDRGTDVNFVNSLGATAIFFSHSKEVAELVVNSGADVNQLTQDGDTPIYEINDAKTVQYLINNGVDVNNQNGHGETALHNCPKLDKALVLLESGINPNTQDIFGTTALHKAISNDRLDIAKALIENGADITIQSRTGERPCDLDNFKKLDISIPSEPPTPSKPISKNNDLIF